MNKKAFKVSFKQENNFSMPLIKAKIDGRDFIFGFDTGAWFNCFSVQGINKWDGGIELYNEAKKMVTSNFDFDLCVDFVTINDTTFNNVPFKYFETDLEYDGIISYSFFNSFNNFVIDFQNNEIRTDEPPICDTFLPLIVGVEKSNNTLWNLLHVCTEINNNEVISVIDTGFSSQEKMIIIADSLDAKCIGKDDYPIFSVDFKLSHLKNEIIKARKLSYGGGAIAYGEEIRESLKNVNIIGCSVFKGHILQVDLKNKVFRIV